ncbi:LINE-1 reverse transcriptase-like protein [Smittium culicis]|uniref:LINE-1 reverse transcriptase-like protein n=1 Tax=Smittium culicis TaxID=133412 RepID=A0A1R1XFS6_9FUNG|nr:LINE-1 reverse transcriptase-like protein [Smittium culicis]
MGLNELCAGLIDTVWDQSARLGALDAPGETIKTVLSKNTINKIKKRRKKFKKLTKNNCPISYYIKSKSNANQSIKADRKAQHTKSIKKIADQILNNDSKSYWRYIKSNTGKSFQSIADGPVYDKFKNLTTEKCEKIKIWTNHFGDLAKDATGNSRSTDKWENLISSDCDYYPECDSTILWSDITNALHDMTNNKAPGADGVPSEVLKLVMTEPSPTSSLAKLIHKIINLMYDTGDIPQCLETSVVVLVPKKGDLKDPDNYRGISLIPTLAKLVAKIVATKLSKIDAKYQILVKEQAGFRNFEECAGQATTLYEIVRRRKIQNKETWLCYIDYSKAYDRVPHMALLHKLRSVGIGGKLLNMIKGMYDAPKIAV